jgi:L-gulonolactone oxidase
VEEIQAIIADALDKGKNIRPLGSGHSWNPMASSDDIYISLYHYRGLVNVNSDKKQITVRGGTRLWEINEIAQRYNLALSVLPGISNQTIGGALATGNRRMDGWMDGWMDGRTDGFLIMNTIGTHGSGVTFGIMMAYVTEIELIDGRGRVHSLAAGTDHEVFHAAGVSLGLLGIITEVTLQCEDSFSLHEIRTSNPLDYCLNYMMDIVNSAEHVKFWIELNSKTCGVYKANRTTESCHIPTPQPFIDLMIRMHEIVFSLLPFTANSGMRLLAMTVDLFEYYDRDHTYDVVNIPHYVAPTHRESEYSIPIGNCTSAINELIQFKETHNIPINHAILVRFVKKDMFWLSNDYGRDSCHITLLLYNPSDELFDFYSTNAYNLFMKYGAVRPHWGKDFYMTLEEAMEVYPKLKHFLQVRNDFDPNGIFLNSFLFNIFIS